MSSVDQRPISASHNAINRVFDEIKKNDPSSSKVLLLDGGTGEELFRRGMPDDRKTWSAAALIKPEYHETLKEVHRSFLSAGSQAITTNSYGVTPGVGFSSEEIETYVALSGKIAREVVDEFSGSTATRLVFGSLGPLVESYRADLIMEHSKGVTAYERVCKALAPNVDAFLAETMSCVDEARQAMDAVASLDESERRPILVSFTLNPSGQFCDGEAIPKGMRRILDEASKNPSIQLLGIMFNCALPEAITSAFQKIHEDEELRERLRRDNILLGAYANRLTAVDPEWTMAESDAPQPMREDIGEEQYWDDFVARWISEWGVKMVGGCCGITPEHIAYIYQHINDSKATDNIGNAEELHPEL